MNGKAKIFSPKELINSLSPLFKEQELQLVLLFGSAASGAVHRKSDLDLAFLFDKPVDILDLTNRVIRCLHTDQVDVVDLRRASPLLAFSAAKHGKILYQRSPEIFATFYSLAFRRYVDTEKLRQAQTQVVRRFVQERMER